MGIIAFTIFDRLVGFLAGAELFLGLLWAGLAALSIALLILAHTRWGQSRPLRKCFILSLLAHFLLAGYATTVTIVASRPTSPGDPVIHVRIGGPDVEKEPLDHKQNKAQEHNKPWEEFAHDAVSRPDAPLPRPPEAFADETARMPEKSPRRRPEFNSALVAESVAHDPKPFDPQSTPSEKHIAPEPEPIEVPAPQRRHAPIVGLATGPGAMGPVPRKPSTTSPHTERIKRSSKIGVSSSLLSGPSPLPLISQPAPTAETADSLASLVDAPSKTTHGRPAAAVIDDTGKIDVPSADQTAGPHEAVAAAQTGRLRGPSLDAIGQKRPPLASTSPAVGLGAETAADNADENKNGVLMPVNNIIGPPHLIPRRNQSEKKPLPNIYRLRVSAGRSTLAIHNGASAETEAAVRAALKWLAKNQNPDGRWESRKHQGGRELHVAGRDRLNAGVKADTAVTGLSLLALLASGHTHKEGPYRENVRQGLEFLLAGQKPNGSLAGRATHYAAMYCHAMAAFALSEAYAMTQDTRLEEPVRRAVAYTLAAQDPSGGGWRYTPSNPGDTSQFGWQLMALKSAELAGIPIPPENRRRMLHFLESVSSGRHQGLAAYRPAQPPSRSMTAEALTCRQFLGMPPASATGLEAGDYIIGHLPGEGRANLYYWYYATIGLYQLQGDHWQRWNDALRTTLVQSQRTAGPRAGSWDPNTVWGGYGGRAYSTALGALCLEVYYRYLPMYVEAAATQRKLR